MLHKRITQSVKTLAAKVFINFLLLLHFLLLASNLGSSELGPTIPRVVRVDSFRSIDAFVHSFTVTNFRIVVGHVNVKTGLVSSTNQIAEFWFQRSSH